MMTVKDVCATIDSETTVQLAYNGLAMPFNILNPLAVEAYGRFGVARISSYAEGAIEIEIAMQPLSVG